MQKKFSPGTCRGLFLEWLIFGGAYVRREVCVSKLIGPVYRKFTVFALFYFVFEGSFPSTSPGGGAMFGGEILRTVFFVTRLGAWRGLFSEFYGNFSMGFKYGCLQMRIY